MSQQPDSSTEQRKKTIRGKGEIRTHEPVSRLPVFKTGLVNHLSTFPTQI